MSDLSDDFRAMREHSASKRASNRERSAHLLRDHGIKFDSCNGGAHLIIDNRIDFWPGTGRWKFRGGRTGFGVFNLIDALKDE